MPFHDRHYGEILPRQQPITAHDFTGSNLCHIIKEVNILRALLQETCYYQNYPELQTRILMLLKDKGNQHKDL